MNRTSSSVTCQLLAAYVLRFSFLVLGVSDRWQYKFGVARRKKTVPEEQCPPARLSRSLTPHNPIWRCTWAGPSLSGVRQLGARLIKFCIVKSWILIKWTSSKVASQILAASRLHFSFLFLGVSDRSQYKLGEARCKKRPRTVSAWPTAVCHAPQSNLKMHLSGPHSLRCVTSPGIQSKLRGIHYNMGQDVGFPFPICSSRVRFLDLILI